ncbi:hypothetical protein H696_00854 [Fonticula alba]|uniref:FZ domain-containing protein n=1 Tax=Fonticula alba TaxID=691883 RepID=A0A058ZH97_FONAL|nr:hypothetical protein H696_00854 [Fonticula alba]KCV73313.1 hypothetical protein H696_00854 [Fonticula alba]|eukprot:XP_009493014.1 hypothetical protein H696_00854 [Fonticula alba]
MGRRSPVSPGAGPRPHRAASVMGILLLLALATMAAMIGPVTAAFSGSTSASSPDAPSGPDSGSIPADSSASSSAPASSPGSSSGSAPASSSGSVSTSTSGSMSTSTSGSMSTSTSGSMSTSTSGSVSTSTSDSASSSSSGSPPPSQDLAWADFHISEELKKPLYHITDMPLIIHAVGIPFNAFPQQECPDASLTCAAAVFLKIEQIECPNQKADPVALLSGEAATCSPIIFHLFGLRYCQPLGEYYRCIVHKSDLHSPDTPTPTPPTPTPPTAATMLATSPPPSTQAACLPGANDCVLTRAATLRIVVPAHDVPRHIGKFLISAAVSPDPTQLPDPNNPFPPKGEPMDERIATFTANFVDVYNFPVEFEYFVENPRSYDAIIRITNIVSWIGIAVSFIPLIFFVLVFYFDVRLPLGLE